jgi:hypothetical protein
MVCRIVRGLMDVRGLRSVTDEGSMRGVVVESFKGPRGYLDCRHCVEGVRDRV